MISAAVPTSESQRVAAFVRRHQTGLWRWLRALGCDSGRAEEHCQDALLAALQDKVDALPPAAASRWLRTAARHLFLMRLRAERRRPQWTSLEDVEASWIALGVDEDGGAAALEALGMCVAELLPRDRELVARRYERQQARNAMARDLGIGEAGVKQALRRVRQKLRLCVERRLASETTTAREQER